MHCRLTIQDSHLLLIVARPDDPIGIEWKRRTSIESGTSLWTVSTIVVGRPVVVALRPAGGGLIPATATREDDTDEDDEDEDEEDDEEDDDEDDEDGGEFSAIAVTSRIWCSSKSETILSAGAGPSNSRFEFAWPAIIEEHFRFKPTAPSKSADPDSLTSVSSSLSPSICSTSLLSRACHARWAILISRSRMWILGMLASPCGAMLFGVTTGRRCWREPYAVPFSIIADNQLQLLSKLSTLCLRDEDIKGREERNRQDGEKRRIEKKRIEKRIILREKVKCKETKMKLKKEILKK